MSSWFNWKKDKIKCIKCSADRPKDLSQACPQCGNIPKPTYMTEGSGKK